MAKTIGGGIGSISDDLVEEILVCLPAKSLTRFKSVCKEWLSLISSDQFCHRHTLRRPKPRPSLILMTNTLQFFYWDPTIIGEKAITPYSPSAPDHRIFNSCGGLLLLCCYHLRNRCCVYNPTTRRSRKISLTDNEKHPYLLDLDLAFDPSKSPYYKIVCIRTSLDPNTSHVYEEERTFQVEVYDSESHTWKLSLEPFKYDILLYGGAHWNNAIYWSTCYFDITKNEIKTLLSSEHQGDISIATSSRYIQESNGRLYKYAKGRIQCESVVLWELGGEDHSQWLFKYHHLLPSTAGSYSTYILGVMGGSAGDDTCSLLTCRAGKIGAYSFVDKSYKDLVDITSQTFYQQDKRFSIEGYAFGESLALV